jgi:type 1 fimbriae regulatory protein FimE
MPSRDEETATLNESPHGGYQRRADRTYLRPDEANHLIVAAGKVGRQTLRDAVLLRLMYRHGLRCSEAVGARWTDFDLDGDGPATYHVRRLKGSLDSKHTLDRDEVLGLRKLRDATRDGSQHLFMSERGQKMSVDMAARIITRAGEVAGLGYVHPHMLRHSAGYMLANLGTDTRAIQAHLGHASIQNTVRYTQLSAKRLADVRVR